MTNEMVNKDPWSDRLSEYLDDDLAPEERRLVEQHIAACAGCQAELAGLRAVVARASALRDAPPDGDLWKGIAARIQPQPARRFSFTMPQLVAAGLALMLLSGGMVWFARLGGPRTDFPAVVADAPDVAPVSFADAEYDSAVADLQQTLATGRTRLDAGTVRVLEENLAAIDRAIAQCREALAADPANAYLNGYLAQARARKLSLLRRAASAAGRSS